jgi:hypothetical protein
MNLNGHNQEVLNTFPNIQVVVTPNGIVVITHLSPFISSSILLDEKTCNDMFKQWLATREHVKRNLQLVEDVKRSKN